MKTNIKGKAIDSCGHLMTIEDFRSCVRSGCIIDYDGIGYYSDGVNEFDEMVNLHRIKSKYSHVVWYNK